MEEILKLWPVIVTIITFIIWLIRLEAKVKSLIKDQCICKESCNKEMNTIKHDIELQRIDFKDDFIEIKEQIKNMNITINNINICITKLSSFLDGKGILKEKTGI